MDTVNAPALPASHRKHPARPDPRALQLAAREEMETPLISALVFLIFFLSALGVLAQGQPGIAVQGIARDDERAALGDETLQFTFKITHPNGNPSYYTETVQIKTDPYGVFSHIIGTGTPQEGNFHEVPYGESHMKLVISVRYNQNDVEISNAPLQYTPYAKHAANGVPTGTIVAFAGTEAKIPPGWTLCDGRDLNTVENAQNLIDLIGDYAPDLRGMFLRGTGTSPVNGQDGPGLGETQEDGYETHTTTVTVEEAGNHKHNLFVDSGGGGSWGGGSNRFLGHEDLTYDLNGNVMWNFTVDTDASGNHAHTAHGTTDDGIDETRPVNYGVNYIIKL